MNENVIDIKILAKDLASSVIKDVRKELDGFNNTSRTSSTRAQALQGAVIGATAAITTFGLSIIGSGIDQLAGFFQDSVDAAVDFERSMVTLSIIAPRFGVSADKAKASAERLGKGLRIGVGPAAESLQNLLKSGLNLEQAGDLLERFTNEAITGKSSSISLAQAVQNLSFAYTTNNSALGNLSGISENFEDITSRGRQSLIDQGIAVEKITDEMAKYEGMIELTNLTLGSAEQFTGSYIDKQAEFNIKIQEAQRELGQRLLPILSDALDMFTELFDAVSPKLGDLVDWLLPEIGRIFKEDIVPGVEDFIDYLGSDQFEKDLQNWKNLFTDIRDTAQSIWDILKEVKKVFDLLTDPSAGIRSFNPGGENYLGNNFTNKLNSIAAGQQQRVQGFANGGDFVTNGPQMITVGDNPGGRERVQVTPLSSPNREGPQGNTYNFIGYDTWQISSALNRQLKMGY